MKSYTTSVFNINVYFSSSHITILAKPTLYCIDTKCFIVYNNYWIMCIIIYFQAILWYDILWQQFKWNFDLYRNETTSIISHFSPHLLVLRNIIPRLIVFEKSITPHNTHSSIVVTTVVFGVSYTYSNLAYLQMWQCRGLASAYTLALKQLLSVKQERLYHRRGGENTITEKN